MNTPAVILSKAKDLAVDAIAREKQLKGGLRQKKIVLIESTNRDWKDLSEEWNRGEILRCAQDDKEGGNA